jgi:hypothetical protein
LQTARKGEVHEDEPPKETKVVAPGFSTSHWHVNWEPPVKFADRMDVRPGLMVERVAEGMATTGKGLTRAVSPLEQADDGAYAESVTW